jgi:hypothetical protein
LLKPRYIKVCTSAKEITNSRTALSLSRLRAVMVS